MWLCKDYCDEFVKFPTHVEKRNLCKCRKTMLKFSCLILKVILKTLMTLKKIKTSSIQKKISKLMVGLPVKWKLLPFSLLAVLWFCPHSGNSCQVLTWVYLGNICLNLQSHLLCICFPYFEIVSVAVNHRRWADQVQRKLRPTWTRWWCCACPTLAYLCIRRGTDCILFNMLIYHIRSYTVTREGGLLFVIV